MAKQGLPGSSLGCDGLVQISLPVATLLGSLGSLALGHLSRSHLGGDLLGQVGELSCPPVNAHTHSRR